MMGFHILHYLLEFAQTHVHWDGNTIQPSHPLLSLPPLALSLSQWIFSSELTLHHVAKLQHQSFQWIFRADFFYDWLAWSPCSPRDSQESSLTPQFKSINSLALSLPLKNLSYSILLRRKTPFSKVPGKELLEIPWPHPITHEPIGTQTKISWLNAQELVVYLDNRDQSRTNTQPFERKWPIRRSPT